MNLDDQGKWVTECDQNRVYQTVETWILEQNLGNLGEIGWLGRGDWVKPPHSEVASPWHGKLDCFFFGVRIGKFQENCEDRDRALFFRNKSCPEWTNGRRQYGQSRPLMEWCKSNVWSNFFWQNRPKQCRKVLVLWKTWLNQVWEMIWGVVLKRLYCWIRMCEFANMVSCWMLGR